MPSFCRAILMCSVALLTARAESLSDILARMDRSAAEFKSFSAKMKRTNYTAVLDETTETNGAVRMRRTRKGTEAVMDFFEPDLHTIYLSGHTGEVYYPKANTVQIYNAGKFASSVDSLVLLGFGTTSTELSKDYEVKVGGAETIGSVHTTRLALTPKSKDIRNMASQIELWIPEGQSNPIQEKIIEPSKDYVLVSYSDMKINPVLPDSAFELKLPANVKKIYPQK
jgi:outer membrane lipoprotein-sorting protein